MMTSTGRPADDDPASPERQGISRIAISVHNQAVNSRPAGQRC
jgi:hypothetical protein